MVPMIPLPFIPNKLLRYFAHFVLVFLYLTSTLTSGFNIDLVTRVVQSGPPGSHFGYSVDLFDGGQQGSWVLVGAPKANSIQSGVHEGGAVYKCSADRRKCSVMPFDRAGHNKRLNGSVEVQSDSKSNQWFGATVKSTSSGHRILACAPHYTFFYSTFDKRDPVGTCFMVQDYDFQGRNVKEFSPCRKEKKWGFHRLGYCMAGHSAALPDDGEDFFLGAPGAYYFQGALIHQLSYHPGQDIISKEGPEEHDDRYLGYAVTTGDFDSDGKPDAAIGAPKGNELLGLVALYDTYMKTILNFTGDQKGSYFGSSLTSGDIDGDGFDDLVVGAPLYSVHNKDKGSAKSRYECGRVYVYFQGERSIYAARTHIDGPNQWSRFGLALAFAGDLNGDGFGDLIVGAPYDGPNRRGAIYIFFGMQDIRHHPGSGSSGGISTFGFSLAGGRDLDGNHFPDLVIGAYKSDLAVVLKTRPIVSLQGVLDVSPKELDLDEKNCNISGPVPVVCGKIKICLSYTGKGVTGKITVNAQLRLDVEPQTTNRTQFLYTNGNVIDIPMTLDQDKSPCETKYYYVSPGIQDKLTPIVIKANYSLVDHRPRAVELKPVLDAFGVTTLSQSVEFKKNCGKDRTCIPDLQLLTDIQMCKRQVAYDNCSNANAFFTIGADEYINVTVSAYNNGEDAYNARLLISFPPDVDYENYATLSPGGGLNCDAPVTYSIPTVTKKKGANQRLATNVSCSLGNPLPQKTSLEISFRVSVRELTPKIFQIFVLANSTNPDDRSTMADNDALLNVELQARPAITLLSRSLPDNVAYEKSQYNPLPVKRDSQLGRNVTHIYQVRNDGPSEITGTRLDIYWPWKTLAGNYLLYLSREPRVWGAKGKCEVSLDVINPESFIITYPDDPKYQWLTAKSKAGIFKRSISSDNPNNYNNLMNHYRNQSSRHATNVNYRESNMYHAPNEHENSNVYPSVVGNSNYNPDTYPKPINANSTHHYAPEAYLTEQSERLREYRQTPWLFFQDESAGTANIFSRQFRRLINKIRKLSVFPDYTSFRSLNFNCSELGECILISCEIGKLPPGADSVVQIDSWLWTNTLIDEAFYDATISSAGVAHVTALPYELPPGQELPIQAAVAFTYVSPKDPTKVAPGVPWWLWLIAAIAGFSFFLLIALLLWKLGFFNRKRPPREKAHLSHNALLVQDNNAYYGQPTYGTHI